MEIVVGGLSQIALIGTDLSYPRSYITNATGLSDYERRSHILALSQKIFFVLWDFEQHSPRVCVKVIQ